MGGRERSAAAGCYFENDSWTGHSQVVSINSEQMLAVFQLEAFCFR